MTLGEMTSRTANPPQPSVTPRRLDILIVDERYLDTIACKSSMAEIWTIRCLECK